MRNAPGAELPPQRIGLTGHNSEALPNSVANVFQIVQRAVLARFGARGNRLILDGLKSVGIWHLSCYPIEGEVYLR